MRRGRAAQWAPRRNKKNINTHPYTNVNNMAGTESQVVGGPGYGQEIKIKFLFVSKHTQTRNSGAQPSQWCTQG